MAVKPVAGAGRRIRSLLLLIGLPGLLAGALLAWLISFD
jgi:hypothetical protein